MHLLSARILKVEVAILSRKSVLVKKHTEPLAEEKTLVDRSNTLYGGTLVTYGTEAADIVATVNERSWANLLDAALDDPGRDTAHAPTCCRGQGADGRNHNRPSGALRGRCDQGLFRGPIRGLSNHKGCYAATAGPGRAVASSVGLLVED